MLEIERVSKTFPGTKALDDVSFSVSAGSIHALVGMNGSGKSTLVKLLTGYHSMDAGGRILVNGVDIHRGHHGRAGVVGKAGVRVVHQDLGLIETASVTENLAFGQGFRTGRAARIRWRDERKRARALLDSFGYHLDVRARVEQLRPSERTGVAIARALGDWDDRVHVLVLDEPTASMPGDEVQRLFEAIRRIRELGVAVVYISHRLDEVFELADTASVLRDGRLVGTLAVEHLDHATLVEMIVGRRLGEAEFPDNIETTVAASPLLELSDVSGVTVQGLRLVVHAGEVVGVAGVTGSGREELGAMVFGRSPRQGRVFVDGQNVPPLRPDRSIRIGVVYIPPDRRAHAMFIGLTVRENVTVSGLREHLRAMTLRRSAEVGEVNNLLSRFSIKCGSSEATMDQLSGGNQQKVVFARWFRRSPRVFILDEPSQGVDVSAKADLHQAIVAAARNGAAVLVCSADSDELEAICDRVLVLVDGHVEREYSRADLSADEIDRTSLASHRQPTVIEVEPA